MTGGAAALSRRSLLKLGGAAGFAAAVRGAEGAEAFPPVPAEVELEIAAAAARYRLWKGGDETVVFPAVADLHDGAPDIADPPDWNQPKMHILYAARAAEAFGADFIAELGDIGEDRDLEWKPVALPVAERRYRSQARLLAASPVPAVCCIGNHDLSSTLFALPSSDFGHRFNGAAKARGARMSTGPGEDYGYLDIAAKKFRAIFLNTADLNAYNTGRKEWRGIGREQIAFVEKALDVPADWSVAVLSHITLCPGLGRVWSDNPAELMAGQAETLELLKAFVRRGGRLLGTFAGHSHQDWDATEDGVFHLVTQGSGGCPYTWLLPEARYLRRPSSGALLFDVVALKPAKREGRVFRVGLGGAAADRPFPHPAYGATDAAMDGRRVHFTCPSLLRRKAFVLEGAKMAAGCSAFSSEVRDGVRFVSLDLSAGWTRAEALDFLRGETAKGDLTAVVLNRPLWMPGNSAPLGFPGARPPQSWRNYELREHILEKTPNLLAVFAAAEGYSCAVRNGRAQVTCPPGGSLEVTVN